MAKRTFLIWIILLAVLVVGVSAAAAQVTGEDLPPGVTADDVYRLSSKMYCEVCQGVPISACPSPTCAAWRQEMADMLGQGYTDAEIMQYFADRYGDDVTGLPLASSGQRDIALGLPILLALAAACVVVWQIWRLRERGETRALQAARAAGLREDFDRPVPDNVDVDYLERFLQLLEEKR